MLCIRVFQQRLLLMVLMIVYMTLAITNYHCHYQAVWPNSNSHAPNVIGLMLLGGMKRQLK